MVYRFLLRKEPEGGFTIMVPSLLGCIIYGETVEKLIAMAKKPLNYIIESLVEHGNVKTFHAYF